jgi:predicted phosphodiesterase
VSNNKLNLKIPSEFKTRESLLEYYGSLGFYTAKKVNSICNIHPKQGIRNSDIHVMEVNNFGIRFLFRPTSGLSESIYSNLWDHFVAQEFPEINMENLPIVTPGYILCNQRSSALRSLAYSEPSLITSVPQAIPVVGVITPVEVKPEVKPPKVTKPDLATNAAEQYMSARNEYLVKVKPGTVYFSTQPATKKILSLSDLHMPFHDTEALEMALEHDGNADILVLNGDILDCYSVSSYSKDKGIPLQVEYQLALDFIREMTSRFEEVHLVKGNHENRVDRYLSQKLDPYSAILGNRDIVDKLSKGLILDENGFTGRSYNFTNVYYNELGLPWLGKVGKTIFMHPDTYLAQPGATVTRGMEYLRGQLPWDSFDSIVMGHTHKQAKLIEQNKLLIEQGALCLTQGYLKQAEFRKRPSIVGYAVIYQDKDGNIRPDISNFNYIKTINIFE